LSTIFVRQPYIHFPMKHLLQILTLTFFMNLAGPVIAQAPLRVEIEAKRYAEDFHIVPVGKSGLLLFYESAERSKDGSRDWIFTKYDTEFKEVWTREQPVKSGLDFIDFVVKGEKDVYLLLGNKYGATVQGVGKGNYQVVNVDLGSGNIRTVNGRIPTSSIIDHFDVVNGFAYLSGIEVPSRGTQAASTCLWILPVPCISYVLLSPVIFKAHPVIYQVDLSTGTSSVVSKRMKGMGFIVGTGSSDADHTESVIIRNEPTRKTHQVLCHTYTAGGGLIGSVEIKGAPDKVINRANHLKLNPKEGVMIGTYSNAAIKKGFFRNLGPNRIMNGYNAVSSGLFFSKISESQTEFTRYYDFSEFQSFYKYVQAKYGPYVAEKKRKKPRFSSYLLLIHDIIQKDGQYVMIAEAYYPEYETRYEHVYVPASGNTPGHYEWQPREVFVGFRYTHAIVAGFDKDGNKIWDNTFEIENILTYDLKERVKVLFEGGNTILAYSQNGSIMTKVIQGNEVVQGKFSTPIETNYQGDQVMFSYASDMSYWYDNFFVTYGYQRIKNADDPSKKGGVQEKKRTVFYFNKIAFQ
jgi:hypothetical protein